MTTRPLIVALGTLSLGSLALTSTTAEARCYARDHDDSSDFVEYSGSWESWNEGDGGSVYLHGTAMANGEYLGGGAVSFFFRGSGVSWYSNGTGIPASSLADVDVSIDGSYVDTISLSGFSWSGDSQVVFEASDLGPGFHVLTLDNVALGSSWGSSWYGWMLVDHFRVDTFCH